ncbi:MAG: NAD-dependent protein deacylase, partial [Rhodocyclaceae bacterium]|nr:NAD-dependent protein deacylase [Rhodocyclaceae bacterium]
GWLRPEVVFFGEMLPTDALSRLQAAMAHPELDLVVSIGTTSVFPYIVEPVAHAIRHGITSVEINPGETSISAHVQYALKERAAPALQAILAALATAPGEA